MIRLGTTRQPSNIHSAAQIWVALVHHNHLSNIPSAAQIWFALEPQSFFLCVPHWVEFLLGCHPYCAWYLWLAICVGIMAHLLGLFAIGLILAQVYLLRSFAILLFRGVTFIVVGNLNDPHHVLKTFCQIEQGPPPTFLTNFRKYISSKTCTS